jgi:hypothetical protein
MTSHKPLSSDEAPRDAAPRMDRGRGRQRRAAGLGAVAIIATILALTMLLPLVADQDGAARVRRDVGSAAMRAGHRSGQRHRSSAPLSPVSLDISPQAAMLRVPRSFFGLSTEYWSLPLYERHVALFNRALSLLRVRGGGPLILRIGGDSADHAFWRPTFHRLPWWAFKLTPAWVRQTSALVRGQRMRLILDLNLVTDSPRVAARWARAAESNFPRRSIVAFEIGNEPDLYAHWYWLASIGRTRLAANILPRALSAGIYSRDFQVYAQMLARIAPGVPLAGPALANPKRDAGWLTSLLASPHSGLGIVTVHRYPYSACVSSRSPHYPTIPRLLSESASAGIARSVEKAVSLAHGAGLPLRLTEMNSVTCSGTPGVSDTFATALWAPDVLFELLHAAVDGVNIHLRANTINAPFALNSYGLTARPLYYGLILFARALGPDATLVRSHLHAKPSLHLKAWAVRLRGGLLHVLLIDKGSHPTRVQMRLPARGPATVERLLAPSVSSRSGVTLAGRHLDAAARWEGRRDLDTLTPGSRGYQLTIPARSAALLSVRLRPGALNGPVSG